MRRGAVLGTLFVLVIALAAGTVNSLLSGGGYHGGSFVKGVPPFSATGGRIVSYDEFVGFIRSEGLTIYLPSWLPRGYSLTAVWGRDTDHGLGFPLIIVYSEGDVRDYRAREDNLVVEITKPSPAPLRQYLGEGAMPIHGPDGELIGVLLRNAYCPTCVSQKTLPLAIVRMGGLEYLISFRDADTLVKIVSSMEQLSIK